MSGMLTRLLHRKRQEENDPHELSNLARTVLLRYLQSWGQSQQERADVLKRAAEYCGFAVQFEDKDGVITPLVPSEDFERWRSFRRDLESCWPLGEWEAEHSAVCGVLARYAHPDSTGAQEEER